MSVNSEPLFDDVDLFVHFKKNEKKSRKETFMNTEERQNHLVQQGSAHSIDLTHVSPRQ